MKSESAAPVQGSVLLGRQPILDREQRIVAYELLFRSAGGGNAATVECNFTATAEVVVRAFMELGLTNVLGDYQGYINVDEWFLTSDLVEMLPKDRVVLEILETVEFTPAIVARLRDLRQKGMRLALDDLSSVRADQVPIMDLIEVVKVDLLALDAGGLPVVLDHLQRWPVRLLAEKIDDRQQFERCHRQGFGLFQGYYFAKPTILVGRRVDPARTGVLRLVNLVAGDVEVGQLEQEFKQCPSMAYNLLRLVNSVAFGLPAKIVSLRHAITILGRRQLQRWLQLLLFTQRADGAPSGQPLLALAASRGKLMELMMDRIAPGNRGQADQAFMVGVLSLLDALFGVALSDLLVELNLTDAVRAALLRGEGLLGQMLDIVRAQEQNRFADLDARLAELPQLSLSDFNQAQIQALGWANQLSVSAGG